MSRTTTFKEAEARLAFAKEAAVWFSSRPERRTYTETGTAGVIPGELCALRWGRGNDCVMVFRAADDSEPTIFEQAIKTHQNLGLHNAYGTLNTDAAIQVLWQVWSGLACEAVQVIGGGAKAADVCKLVGDRVDAEWWRALSHKEQAQLLSKAFPCDQRYGS